MAEKKPAAYFAYYLPSLGVSGVLRTWEECEARVRGYAGALYKKFPTHRAALEFLVQCVEGNESFRQKKTTVPYLIHNALYFDSGTGRGEGVEVSVTNAQGEPQLYHLIASRVFLNPLTERGTYLFSEGYTNNFGELFGLFCALKIASLLEVKQIFGDSQLVLQYWSLGRWNASKLPEATVSLAMKVTRERREFEAQGGKILRVSGSDNPADLGFHK